MSSLSIKNLLKVAVVSSLFVNQLHVFPSMILSWRESLMIEKKKRTTKQSTLFKFQSIYQENTNWKYYFTWSSASHAKVYPFAGRRKYLLFSATLRPWVLFRPRESNPWPPALQSSALPTELILPWIRNYLCPRMLGVSLQMCQFKHSRYWQAPYLFWVFY